MQVGEPDSQWTEQVRAIAGSVEDPQCYLPRYCTCDGYPVGCGEK